MVDVANLPRIYQRRIRAEVCSCREGTRDASILGYITEGRATLDDLNTLEDLANDVRSPLFARWVDSSNPVLSTIRYFRHDMRSTILDKRCSPVHA